jgi:hypothetical protein
MRCVVVFWRRIDTLEKPITARTPSIAEKYKEKSKHITLMKMAISTKIYTNNMM